MDHKGCPVLSPHDGESTGSRSTRVNATRPFLLPTLFRDDIRAPSDDDKAPQRAPQLGASQGSALRRKRKATRVSNLSL